MATSPAWAATTYEVEVGRLFNAEDPSRESMRFYPASISVHQGDLLHFTSESFHAVALLPEGRVASDWVGSFALGIDKPWSVFQRDPDEGKDALKVNVTAAYPSAECGWTDQSPCSFVGDGGDLDGVLNSGIPFTPASGEGGALDFSVTIDADPGQTFWAFDPVYPEMHMRIDVVAAEEASSDPAALASEGDELFAQDSRAASALHKRFSNKRVKKTSKGRTTWTAWAGVDTATVSLRKLYPTGLTIDAGDSVKWVFSKNRFSAHTVTLPASSVDGSVDDFPEMVCDEDGDNPGEDPEPDTAASPSVPFCEAGSEFELDVPNDLTRVRGNGVVTRAKDLESSGFRGAGPAPRKDAYTLRFSKRTKAVFSDAVAALAGFVVRGKVTVR